MAHQSLLHWKKGVVCSVTVAHAQHYCQGPREPCSSQTSLWGRDAAPPSLRGIVQAPPAIHPPTQETRPSMILHSGLVTARLPRSEEIIAPGGSLLSLWIHLLLGKFLQDQGHWPRLTQGEEQPSFHMELHPEPVALPPACQLTQPPAQLQAQAPLAGVQSACRGLVYSP